MVLAANLWMQNAQADVRVVTSTEGSWTWPYAINSWCPSGYLLTGCSHIPNTSVGPTGCLGNGYYSNPNNGGDGQVYFPTVIAICAKVCN